jgi:DNA polymerase-1
MAEKNNKLSGQKEERLLLIDGDALLYRAYYVLPPLKTKKGELVNAVYGFLLIFLKAVRDFRPDFIAAVFDFPAPTFRHKKFEKYKSKRPKTPSELREQFPLIKKILANFHIPVFEKEGFEADDIIGTIIKKSRQDFPELEIIILTGDRDLLCLVDEKTKVYLLRRGVKEAVLCDEKKVEEKYKGLKPGQLSDFKGLCGDSSDNIPGVFGVGEKTAISLIKMFGNLENLYRILKRDRSDSLKIKQSLKKKLLKHEEEAFLSKELSEISFRAPLDFDLEECSWAGYDREKVKQNFQNYGFKTLIGRLP